MSLVIVMNHIHHFPLERHAKIMLLDPNTSSVYIRLLRPAFFSVHLLKAWLKSGCVIVGNLTCYRESPDKGQLQCGTKYCFPCHKMRAYFHLFVQSIFLLSVLQQGFLGWATFASKSKRSRRPSFCIWASLLYSGGHTYRNNLTEIHVSYRFHINFNKVIRWGGKPVHVCTHGLGVARMSGELHWETDIGLTF